MNTHYNSISYVPEGKSDMRFPQTDRTLFAFTWIQKWQLTLNEL